MCEKCNKGKYYITTAIAYASGKPHIGNTYEIVLADAIARYKRSQGYDVFFQTGTDEHGQKIELKADEAGVTPKEFVDNASGEIKKIWDLMNTSYDKFIRTTDEDHEAQVKKIFKKLYDQGDIYKGAYEGMYCTPCESFWTESQLVDGKCPDCGRECKPAKEEAYFFKMSKYADRLIDLLTAMGRDYYQFVSIAPQEKLMQYFRVSILAGVVVTVPVAFYNIYAFAKPGLKKSESTFFKLVMLLGLILFCVGVLFAYKLMMPFMLRFLSTGIEGAEYIQTTTSIESYVNLCLTMFIIFGCVFEMPLITIILSKMGIINPQILKQVRGVAIVVIFFIAAVVTPPDIVSQCMVAFPMVLLYFVSIFLSGIFYKPRDTDEDDEEEEESED